MAAAPLMTGLAAAPALAETAHKPHPAAKPKSAAKKPARKPAPPPAYGDRDDVMAFADAQAESLGYRREELRAILALARPQPAVQRLILPGRRDRRRTGAPTVSASSSRSGCKPGWPSGRRTRRRSRARRRPMACRRK
ncbi:hypothetical protein [Mitsuaria sp. TWR114]|uniref:hypothetical protein n=1 Tax=Mitsuaria sp. TWR114 TaxID=2601731 RepID=UPI0021020A73|nr:hypothetical protein [Mitsuaria sp. TWR114]